MKTPEEVLTQECDWLQVDVIYVRSIEKAMKEYAKQWVQHALEESHEINVAALVEQYDLLIDEHGY